MRSSWEPLARLAKQDITAIFSPMYHSAAIPDQPEPASGSMIKNLNVRSPYTAWAAIFDLDPNCQIIDCITGNNDKLGEIKNRIHNICKICPSNKPRDEIGFVLGQSTTVRSRRFKPVLPWSKVVRLSMYFDCYLSVLLFHVGLSLTTQFCSRSHPVLISEVRVYATRASVIVRCITAYFHSYHLVPYLVLVSSTRPAPNGYSDRCSSTC